MNFRVLGFCLSLLAVLVLIKFIPWLDWFQVGLTEQNRWLERVWEAILVTGLSLFVAHKARLHKMGGFSGHKRAAYWILLLPFFFPGLLMFRVSHFTCSLAFSAVITVLVSKLANALTEELVFRGLILGRLLQSHPGQSPHRYCVISAVLFSLMHAVNLQHTHLVGVLPQLIYAFYGGLMFAAILIRTRNIWLLGLCHGLLNFAIINLCPVPDESIEAGAIGLTDYLSATGGAVLLFSPMLLIYWLLLKSRK